MGHFLKLSRRDLPDSWPPLSDEPILAIYKERSGVGSNFTDTPRMIVGTVVMEEGRPGGYCVITTQGSGLVCSLVDFVYASPSDIIHAQAFSPYQGLHADLSKWDRGGCYEH